MTFHPQIYLVNNNTSKENVYKKNTYIKFKLKIWLDNFKPHKLYKEQNENKIKVNFEMHAMVSLFLQMV